MVQPDFNIPDLYQNSDSEEDDAATTATKRKSFTCRFCQKVLRTKKGLRIHQRRHTGEKLRSCELCNAKFTRTHHLIRHVKTHSSDPGHLCAVCGLSFMKLSHLLSHKKVHKTESAEKSDEGENMNGKGDNAANNSECDDITFEIHEDGDDEHTDSLEEYFKPKTKSKKKEKGTFECKFCCKIMTTFVGLKIHMRRHTGDDLVKCKVSYI